MTSCYEVGAGEGNQVASSGSGVGPRASEGNWVAGGRGAGHRAGEGNH